MTEEESKRFLIELKQLTDLTPNVRVTENWQYSGLSNISFEVLKKIGKSVEFLSKAKLCEGNEYLLIYNLQKTGMDSSRFYELGIMVKSLKQLEETHVLMGKVLDIVLDAETDQIIDSEEVLNRLDNIETPVKDQYGSYRNCSTPVFFFSRFSAVQSEKDEIPNRKNMDVPCCGETLTRALTSVGSILNRWLPPRYRY